MRRPVCAALANALSRWPHRPFADRSPREDAELERWRFAAFSYGFERLTASASPTTQRPPQIEGAPNVSIPGFMLWGKDEPGSATFVIRVKNNGKKVIKGNGLSWERSDEGAK